MEVDTDQVLNKLKERNEIVLKSLQCASFILRRVLELHPNARRKMINLLIEMISD